MSSSGFHSRVQRKTLINFCEVSRKLSTSWGQLDENIFESRKLNTILGGLTANYAVAVKASVRFCVRDHGRRPEIAPIIVRWKDTSLATTVHASSNDRNQPTATVRNTNPTRATRAVRRGTYKEGLSEQEAVQNNGCDGESEKEWCSLHRFLTHSNEECRVQLADKR